MEKLEAYLSSPYFETPPKALTLFQYLKKLHPNFEEKKMTPAVIEKKSPGLGNQKKQANYGSDLLKAIEHFLALEDFQSSADNLSRHRLQAYKKHHLFEQFNKEHQQQLEQLNKNEEQDIDVFYNRHILTEVAMNGFDKALNRTIQNDIFPVTKTLDEFYALKRLRYNCELLNRHRVLGTAYNEENIGSILNALQPFNNGKYPYVYLFVNVYQMLKAETFESGEKYHSILQGFVEQNKNKILSEGVRETINYAINHCQYWNNRGYKQAGTSALWWGEVRINYDLLLQNGLILPAEFRMIVSLSIDNTKPPSWIKNFIDTYSSNLPVEQAETNIAFALAQYYYYTKNYAKAMPLFQQAQVKEEYIFNAIVRRWQFMCMYEQDSTNTDLLFSFLDAYEKYIQRNAASFHKAKDLFLKNIFYSKKMLKATDVKLRTALNDLLKTEIYFPGKEWLLKEK